MNITEVDNSYTDEQGYIHIDAFGTGEYEGKTVAIVCEDTLKVYYIDNTVRDISIVKEAIEDAVLTAKCEAERKR